MTPTNKLADALRRAEPYVLGAYECAFPDEIENAYVAADIREALVEYDASLAAPPAQGEGPEFPPLPSNPAVVDPGRFGVAYSADQMRTYARETIAYDSAFKNGWNAGYNTAIDEAPQPAPAPVQAEHGLTSKQAWWAGVRIGLGLPPDCPRTEVAAAIAQRRAQPPAPGEAVLPPIERDRAIGRDYIPLPGGWEVQTRGRGSTFRICDTKSGERVPVVETMLHPWLERMAREVRAAIAALAQQRVPDAVRELPGKWRKDARELGRSGDSSGIWNRTSEQRADELESVLALIDQQQEARGNGE